MSDLTDIVSRLRRVDVNRGVGICSEAADKIDRLRAEIDALKERLASVEQIARQAPELNPSNYDHDQVCELNDAMIQVWKEVKP